MEPSQLYCNKKNDFEFFFSLELTIQKKEKKVNNMIG